MKKPLLLLFILFAKSLTAIAQTPAISYPSPQVYTTGTAITPLMPMNSGGVVPAVAYQQVSTIKLSGTEVYNLAGMVIDASGNIFGIEGLNLRVKKITPSGVASIFAGNGVISSVDGIGTAASFKSLTAIAIDNAGVIYVGEYNKIRKITPDGVVRTFVGSGIDGSANGLGTAASFKNIQGLAIDGTGNLYVSDSNNNLIRKVSPSGLVSTLAGTGVSGDTDGIGSIASFNQPNGLTLDGKGNLFVADNDNNRIRKVTPAGIVSTFAGSGYYNYPEDGPAELAKFFGPNALAFDKYGNLYVSDSGNHLIRMINADGIVSTVFGNGIINPIDGIGIMASFYAPHAIAFDNDGHLYVSDLNSGKIRKINLTGYSISPALPEGLIFDSSTGIVSGNATANSPAKTYTVKAFNKDGFSSTSFTISTAIPVIAPAISSFNPTSGGSGKTILITGTNFLGASGITIGGVNASAFNIISPTLISAIIAPSTSSGAVTVTNPYGTTSISGFTISSPPAISYSEPQTTYNTGIAITPLTPMNTGGTIPPTVFGQVSTFAGSGTYGSTNGTATQASFNGIRALSVDIFQNIYVLDGLTIIRKITPAGLVSTLAGSKSEGSIDAIGTAARFNALLDITTDAAGNVYVADRYKIRKITSLGVVSTFAGKSGPGSMDGSLADATFGNTIVGMEIDLDGAGNMYIADTFNSKIRIIKRNGFVTTLAGSGGFRTIDGVGSAASFKNLTGIALDPLGNANLSDAYKIRKVTALGMVSTVAGNEFSGSADGPAAKSSFKDMNGLAADASGYIYIADTYNNKIRLLNSEGSVSTLAGTGTVGLANNVGILATFANPNDVALDNQGNLFVADRNVIRKIVLTGYSISPSLPTGLIFNNATGVISGTPTSVTSATKYTITGYNSSGSSITNITFATFDPTLAPQITSLSTSTAKTGSLITLIGTNLTGATAVSFGGISASSFTVVSATSITATVGTGASGVVSVTTPTGTTTLSGFNFVPVPTITAAGSTTFNKGGSVILNASPGTGYTYLWKRDGTAIFNATSAAYTATQTGNYTVTISLNSVSQASTGINVQAITAPTITNINPLTVVEGAQVTITGTDFTGATAVSFGGMAAESFMVNSPTNITAVVGSISVLTTSNISVTTPSGTGTLAGLKTIPEPIISASGTTTFYSGGMVTLTAAPGIGYSYQWKRDGVNISGATTSTYTATESGLYTVSISVNSLSRTSAAATVKVVFSLPANNFKFTARSATCKGSANGSLNITTSTNLDFTVSITGNNINSTYKFNTFISIDNLPAGSYSVCMTLTAQPEFQQCFTSVITEPKDLSVYTATIKNDQIVLSLNGASIYNVSLNGKSYTTSESEITLSLSPGVNAISISTDKACQGVVEKSITYTENARVYPNPFSNTLNLDLGNNKVKKAIISIFTLDGKQIFTSNHYNAEGVVQLDLSSLNSGLYMLKLSADNLETIFKIVKK